MELLRKLSPKYTNNGRCVSYAIFWCEYCESEVERRLGDGKKAKSCGCYKNSEEYKQSMSSIKKGWKMAEESKQKIREKAKERYKNPKNNPMYGKIVSEETRQKLREANTGHIVTEVSRRKIIEARKNQKMACKENHWNWNNGSSFLPYPPEFNKQIKKQILERDNYTCQCPDCKHTTNNLDIHHIDYDKTNNSPENLITLCDFCHTKTNGKNKRQYWIEFYQNIMIGKVIECLL